MPKAAIPPAITVIIPVYNRQDALAACIEALLAQSFTDFEIILVDDCSTDDTGLYCRTLAVDFAAIHCITLSRNSGQGTARNAGLACAQGEYVFFADGDDILRQDALYILHANAQKTQADIVIFGYTALYGAISTTYLPAEEYTTERMLLDRKILPPVWNKFFRRTFLQKNALVFPESRCAEDLAFMCKALVCAPAIAVYRHALYTYRACDNNTSHDLRKRSDTLISLQDIKTFLQARSLFTQYQYVYYKLVVDHALRYPLHLLLVASLWQGKNRKNNLHAFPGYLKNLCVFVYSLWKK